jgi:hypothetical protein
MAYTPNSSNLYTAVYSGALAGIGASDKTLTSDDPTSYAGPAEVAGAFAQEFDTLWGSTAITDLVLQCAQEASYAFWAHRCPAPVAPFLDPDTYVSECAALIAMIQRAQAFFLAEGITENAGLFLFFGKLLSNATPTDQKIPVFNGGTNKWALGDFPSSVTRRDGSAGEFWFPMSLDGDLKNAGTFGEDYNAVVTGFELREGFFDVAQVADDRSVPRNAITPVLDAGHTLGNGTPAIWAWYTPGEIGADQHRLIGFTNDGADELFSMWIDTNGALNGSVKVVGQAAAVSTIPLAGRITRGGPHLFGMCFRASTGALTLSVDGVNYDFTISAGDVDYLHGVNPVLIVGGDVAETMTPVGAFHDAGGTSTITGAVAKALRNIYLSGWGLAESAA